MVCLKSGQNCRANYYRECINVDADVGLIWKCETNDLLLSGGPHMQECKPKDSMQPCATT